MYGSGIGLPATGVAGGAALVAAETGALVIGLFAAAMGVAMIVGLVRNATRRAADKRP